MMWKYIQKYLGWRGWAVFQYNSIFENLFVIFFLLLLNGQTQNTTVFDILIFALFSILSTTYGYLVNDFADRALDAQQGKSNTFSADSTLKAIFIILPVLAFSGLTALRFIGKPYFILLWAAWFLLSTFYSLPPFRLKEAGKFGLIAVVFAQRFIPILMVFSIFQPVELKFMLLLGIYVFFRGLSSDLNHQMEDYKNDVKTATRTFAVEAGARHSRVILRFSLEMEKALLPIILVVAALHLQSLDIYLYLILLSLSGLYFLGYLYSFIQIATSSEQIEINPFASGPKNVFQFLNHSYPSVILALGLNFILIFLNPLFSILLLLQLWMRGFYKRTIFENSFIINFIRKK